MKKLLEQWHIDAIKTRIDEGLRVRCINVQTTLELIERKGAGDGKQHLVLASTSFNTVPVIHSSIVIEEFGADVYTSTQKLTDTGEDIPCVRFYVSVHARYEGNGTGLFRVSGQVQERTPNTLFFDTDKREGERESVYNDSL